MSDNAKIQSTSQSASSAPSAERRRLLRAAAVSAPFIATLPTNLAAAVANASTSQCMVDDREASDEQGEENRAFDAADSPDKWIRVEAKRVRLKKVEKIDGVRTKKIRTYYTGIDPFNDKREFCYVGEKWDLEDGEEPKSLGDTIFMSDIAKLTSDEGGWTEVKKQSKKVLAMFEEEGDKGYITGLEHKGMYPQKQRSVHTAATHSCMCSVDPEYREKNCA